MATGVWLTSRAVGRDGCGDSTIVELGRSVVAGGADSDDGGVAKLHPAIRAATPSAAAGQLNRRRVIRPEPAPFMARSLSMIIAEAPTEH